MTSEKKSNDEALTLPRQVSNLSSLDHFIFVKTRMSGNVYKDPDDGRQRFLLELEFIQCLANPTYIHYLAQNLYFEDEAFICYLKYLKYWQQAEYLKFI
ncbi:hypothetical protein MKW94_004604, partial [Papaver nudicaule]|nr:hypothetical protein [Papaver nudicaule]